MPYKLIYFDEARLDVRNAKDWYKQQQEGLEKRFAQAIKSAIKHLAKMPTANAIRYKISASHTQKFFLTSSIIILTMLPDALLL